MKLFGQNNSIAQRFDSEALASKRIDLYSLSKVSGGRKVSETETVDIVNGSGKRNGPDKKG